MSIFQLKPWWSSHNSRVDLSDSISCLKIDRFCVHSNGDCILVTNNSLLTIYSPDSAKESSNTLLEIQFNDVILEIDTGKFTANANDRQVFVLHPQSYSVFSLSKKEGHTDAGDQYFLHPLVKHSFTKSAYSSTCGSFGGVKTRDFVSIQGLDASLSFFDQDIFLFMCIFDDVLIPNPVHYINSCDSFVICKSTWTLEIYSYEQLREFSQLNTHIRQNKKNIPQWSYNTGEEITSLQVIQTSTNISSIVALCERHLYCFQDNGLMKYIIKFDFLPLTFYAYLIGWYYEPGARLLVMVASDDDKLYVYEDSSLLWSCGLLEPTIMISRCFLRSLPGGVVSLSNGGVVTVGYLGTEPDLNATTPAMINEPTDPQKVQDELNDVESSLQKIMNEDDNIQYMSVESIIKIKCDVGKATSKQHLSQFNETSDILFCPVIVILTCEEPKLIQSVQITFACCPPFACTDSVICLDNINGTEIIETPVVVTSDIDISDSNIRIFLSITESAGKVSVLRRKVLLPLSLYCKISEVEKENEHSLEIETNKTVLDFTELFSDFTKEEILKYHDTLNTVTFSFRTHNATVTVNGKGETYIIEAKDFTQLAPVLEYVIFKLKEHYLRMGVEDFKLKIPINKDKFIKIVHSFLKSIEIHAKERTKLNTHEDELNILHRQFTLIQKRLLVQYGSLPPGDCDMLEFLMRDTHKRLIKTSNNVLECRKIVYRAGGAVAAMAHFVITILKQNSLEIHLLQFIEEIFSVQSFNEDYQAWEESVTQGTLYFIKNVLKKSDKDKEKLATVTEQDVLSQSNLKRFLKQIKHILERLYTGDVDMTKVTSPENNITRIEEIVEVL